jgi:hypothetical protein
VPTIFRRVEDITINARTIPPDVSELQLQNLSALKRLTLDSKYEWDDEEEAQREARQIDAIVELLPGVELTCTTTLAGETGGQLIESYLKNPTDAMAVKVRKWIKSSWPSTFRHLNEPDETHYGDAMGLDGEEECIADMLGCRHEDLRIAAARELWTRHSRRHAREVIAFAMKLAANSDAARQFKLLCDADLAPGRILVELRKPVGKDSAWWAWLAAMRPHPTLVPALIQMAQEKDALPEVVYALRQSKDPRSLPTLLTLLTKCDDETVRCIAADAIGEMGTSAVEPQLVEALHREDRLTRALVCRALAKVGTARSLPELRKLADDTGYQGTVDVTGAASRAIKAIEGRSH